MTEPALDSGGVLAAGGDQKDPAVVTVGDDLAVAELARDEVAEWDLVVGDFDAVDVEGEGF